MFRRDRDEEPVRALFACPLTHAIHQPRGDLLTPVFPRDSDIVYPDDLLRFVVARHDIANHRRPGRRRRCEQRLGWIFGHFFDDFGFWRGWLDYTRDDPKPSRV